ncbi:NAD-dependent epimerase/dehydratase family protein [Candidatus Poriferisocius sp.]|uniref:NAD-dependent epimerase/dehydratase family protein n=1 Tax=Candidatus Poriferisocius sp. TaxID=3101276 RepID=UPI003B022B62
MDGQKILITGCAGQIALPMTRYFARTNEVWGLARFSQPGSRRQVEEAGAIPHAADLASGELNGLPDDFDYVIHMAAFMAGGSDFDYALAQNAEATGLLMAHCRNARGFLHAATAASYKNNPDHTHPYAEGDPLGDSEQPYSETYAVSKLAAEAVARTLCRLYELPTVIGRINVAYGRNGGLPAILLAMMMNNMPVMLKDSEPNVFAPVHEDDMCAHAEAFLEAATVPAVVVNWGGDQNVSMEDMCRRMGELAGVTPDFQYAPVGTHSRAFDSTRRRAITGPCTVSWEDGIADMVAAYDAEQGARMIARLMGEV